MLLEPRPSSETSIGHNPAERCHPTNPDGRRRRAASSKKRGSSLFGMGELESETLYLFATVVNRYALTQTQRRRGTKGHIPCL